MTLPADIDTRKAAAAAWFRTVRDELCARLEAIEAEGGVHADHPPGRFEITPWARPEGGGGEMGLLHGRVFEKAGVHISVVHGRFSEEFARQMPHTEAGAEFWSAGVSVIIHPWNPNVPAAHTNTRMIATGKWWFGGGGDLPVLDRRRTQTDADSVDFHAPARRLRSAWRRLPALQGVVRQYFFLRHRNEPRGIGGIFYDNHNSGDWDADFAFTQDVGRAFLDIYPQLVRRNFGIRGRSPTATSSSCAAALCRVQPALRSAARCSACAPAAMSRRFCRPCRPRCAGRRNLDGMGRVPSH